MNLTKFILPFWLAVSFSNVYSQKKSQKEMDINAIKAMAGCYEVTFEYGETVSPDKNYKFHDNYYSKGTEWAGIVEETKDKIVIQHILVMDSFVVKHWRQDWIYQGRDVLDYLGNNTWSKKQLSNKSVKGQWTQKVFQVDDSPRYEANGTWIHADGRHYWEAKSNSPLPRREFSKRNDYNILLRRNRHEITDYGWVHEQDNVKILKNTDGTEKIISEEKGWNRYRAINKSNCLEAEKWWAENKNTWNDIRKYIDNTLANANEVFVESKIDNMPLFMYLEKNEYKNAKEIIDLFVKVK